MPNEIDSYIDISLIDEYADKDFSEGYSLDVDSLPDHERANFLELLMQNDTSVRDFVLFSMQKLIDERLPVCQGNDLRHHYMRGIQLTNGDTFLLRDAS